MDPTDRLKAKIAQQDRLIVNLHERIARWQQRYEALCSGEITVHQNAVTRLQNALESKFTGRDELNERSL